MLVAKFQYLKIPSTTTLMAMPRMPSAARSPAIEAADRRFPYEDQHACRANPSGERRHGEVHEERDTKYRDDPRARRGASATEERRGRQQEQKEVCERVEDHSCRGMIVRMAVHTKYLWFETKTRQEFIRITDEVARIVSDSGIQEGMVLVSAMHITAAVYVNDWEDGLIYDFQEWLEKLAPAGKPYRHHQTGEDNADAHLKRTLMGHQVIVPITNGKLDLGPWEQVFYAEFDGQRRKRVIVKVMGEK